jgi:phenylalanyl-tRNA synthetase alpha chain
MSNVKELREEIENFRAESKEALEEFRLRFISRKSVLGDLFSEIKNIAPEERKAFGQQINELKNAAEEKFRNMAAEMKKTDQVSKDHGVDVTLPPLTDTQGSIHPLTIVRSRFIEIFERIGFSVAEGPEIEDD